MTTTITEILAGLGIEIANAPAPAANYVSYSRSGNLLFISGQISMQDGAPAYLGHLGDTVSLEDGKQAARAAALGVIAQIRAATEDRLSALRQVHKLGVFIASTPDFTQQPEVANGASDLMVEVFGEAGRHARAAVGVAALPRGVSVEVEAVVELELEG